MEQIKTSDLYDLGVGSRSKQWRLEKMLVMCSAVRQLAEVNQTLVLSINPAKCVILKSLPSSRHKTLAMVKNSSNHPLL